MSLARGSEAETHGRGHRGIPNRGLWLHSPAPTHSHSETHSLLTGESREQPRQTFKVRKDMQEHRESEIFQEQCKKK